jgi:hypothetical protein
VHDWWLWRTDNHKVANSPPPSPPSRTKWTRLVHPSVLIGHVSSLFGGKVAIVLETGLLAAPRLTLALLVPHLDPRLAALAASVRVEALRSAEAALAGAAPQLARPLAALLFALSPKLALLPLLRARRAPLLTAFLAAHAADDTLSLLAAPRAVAAAEALHGVGLALAALLLRLLPWGWAARYSPAAPQPRSRRAPSRAGAPAGTMSRALTPSLPFPLRVPLL